MSRLSLSDVVQAQEAMIERQARMQEDTLAALREIAVMLAEVKQRPTASQMFALKRAGVGDKPTTIESLAVVQEGETLEDARRRASIEYEKAAARFPLPNGYAHAAPLGDEESPRQPPTLVDDLRG